MTDELIKRSPDSAASVISSGADEGAGPFSSATGNIADQAEHRLNDAGERLGDAYARGTVHARETLDELPATLSDASVTGRRLIEQGQRRVDHGVRKQPVEALLLAGALGYLAGWAVSRG